MKMRSLSIRLAGLGLSVLGAASARGVVISDGAGLGAVGPTDWLGVGLIEKTTDTASENGATGVLIGTRSFLTAGHVVEGWLNSQARIEIDGQIYTSTAIALHPSYSFSNDRYDVAVVTLDRDVTGVTPYAINTGFMNELTSGPATLVGYGVGGDPATGENATLYPYGTKRAGVNTIGMVTTSSTLVSDGQGNDVTVDPGLILFDFDNPAAPGIDPLGDGAALLHEADSTTRDSGAPLFQQYQSQWVITGIAVSGTGDPTYGDIGVNVRMADVGAWVAGQVPEPGALGLAGAAAVGLLRRRRR